MAIFPLAPDRTIAQMWSNGVRGAAFKRSGRTPPCTTKVQLSSVRYRSLYLSTVWTDLSVSVCSYYDVIVDVDVTVVSPTGR